MRLKRRFPPIRAVAILVAAVAAAVIALAVGNSTAEGRLLFDSDFATKRLSAYATVINRERISIVDDPVLGGDARKVVKMTVYDSDTGPTDDPRAQLETPKFLREGQTFYVGFSAMFGNDWSWRMCSRCWVTFHQIYGPPFGGQGPANLNIKSNNTAKQPRITWERTAAFGFDHPFETPMVPMKWYDFVWHEKLSRDPKRGYVELWMNSGDGWRRVSLNGRRRLRLATKIRANGSTSSGNSSNIALYRAAGITPRASMYFAEHRVGTSFETVEPDSYR